MSLDIVAAPMTLLGVFLLTRKNILGWVVGAFANGLWAVHGISSGQAPLAALNVVLLVTSCWGLVRWLEDYFWPA